MKRRAYIFYFFFILISACQVSVPTEPVVQIPHFQTPSPVIALTPSPRPTSTIDEIQRASGGFPFCQVSPREARLGSSVNISAFRLPPNHPISIFIYYETNEFIQLESSKIMTDDHGYVNFDLIIPQELPTETWSRIGLIAYGPTGPLSEASCGIWPWTEISLATYSARQTAIYAPTMTVPPLQAAITATQQFLKDHLGANCYYGSAQAVRLSPNGQWAEAICGYDSIIIIKTDRTKEWNLSSELLIGPYTGHFVHTAHWSIDGKYVYVDVNPHTDGYWEPFHQGMVLYRVNLETGQVHEILPQGKQDVIFYSYGFSPDDSQLAYIVTDKSPVVLKLRDLETTAERSFEFDTKYDTGGGFVWSPDGQKLVFSVTQFDRTPSQYIATSIILWDRETGQLTELVKDHKSQMEAIEWIDETKIKLEAIISDAVSITTQVYEFDLATNTLKELHP